MGIMGTEEEVIMDNESKKLYREYLLGFLNEPFDIFIDSDILSYEEFCESLPNKAKVNNN